MGDPVTVVKFHMTRKTIMNCCGSHKHKIDEQKRAGGKTEAQTPKNFGVQWIAVILVVMAIIYLVARFF